MDARTVLKLQELPAYQSHRESAQAQPSSTLCHCFKRPIAFFQRSSCNANQKSVVCAWTYGNMDCN
eukprot:4503244-Karenia_brevis.AAC.1